MIVEEIMPFVNSAYRTKTGPEHTGLVGSSFGGVVTLYLGLSRPQNFGRLGVVSPSVWWDERWMIRQVESLRSKPRTRIWLDMGTKEGYQGLKDARDLRYALERKGWKLGSDLSYFEDSGAGHNEAAWAKRMEPILRFLYGS